MSATASPGNAWGWSPATTVAGAFTSPGCRSDCSISGVQRNEAPGSSGCSCPSWTLRPQDVAGAAMEARNCYPCARSELLPISPVASFDDGDLEQQPPA